MKTRTRHTGRGLVFEVYHNGRWNRVNLNKHLTKPKKMNHKERVWKRQGRDIDLLKPPETITGGLNDSKKAIDLKTKVSLLTVANLRTHFTLGMGYPGQEKILIQKGSTITDPTITITLKTIHDDNQKFASSKKGNTLLLICDGTYWYPISESMTGTDSPGDWVIST